MKKIIALAAILSASTFAAAHAQDYGQDYGPNTGMSAPATSIDGVNIVNVTNDPSTGQGSRLPASLTNPAPQMIQEAQAELQSDPTLVDALAMQNVQLANVVAIETAANGGKTVYIR